MASDSDGNKKLKRKQDRKMKRSRKDELIQEFSGPLWDDRPEPRGLREVVLLEEFVKASYEDHGYFREQWVFPLLAEGLSMDRVFELLLSGAVLPN